MGGESEVRRRRLLEEIKGLFGPAFGPALEAYGRSFAERISEDEGFRAEVKERFERGRALGGFPELSALLAGMSAEGQEEFFETGWTRVALPPPGPPKDPWDRAPWDGDVEAYRENLYAGMAFAFSDLRAFAREWLEELSRVGYYGMEESLGLPLKQQADDLSPAPTESLPIYGAAYPVRLGGSRQTIWLNLNGPRSEEGGYREIVVSEAPLRTDEAIFAAVTALEGRPLDVARLRKILPEIFPSYGESVWDRWTRALDERRSGGELVEDLEDLRYHQTLDYVLLLLRYHRPGFDEQPLEEKAALLGETCAYVNEFLDSLRKLMAFVEYGVPGRGTVPVARSVGRDVKAAVLKDVEGLTYREIGKRLGVSPPRDFSYKGDHPTVRKMVGRGRRFLKMGLGEEGWQGQVEAMKEEAKRRRGMSEVEREAEDLAEAFGIPYEEALKHVEEEREQNRERKEEPGSA
ncbi:sigma-70 region 4 domain-containing protein [Rubrobacter xylanophilus]|uniref:sigma-70 region 4 domain-containing protein n=1 Tax=Rubrobacter xylanophilus TaxID=49319 RepID=UPI00117B1EC4|nr:sigma-70 region 4 domain-containing protein [Rubrobacter xylanophilus]